MIIVGGMGNIYGVILGAVVLEYLNFTGLDKIGEGINNGIDLVGIDQSIDIPKYKFLIFGTLLVIMMLARPEGLIPSARRKAELHEGEEEGPETTYGDLYDVRREGHDGGSGVGEPRRLPAPRAGRAEGVRRPRCGQRCRLHHSRGKDREPDRPERRRQDDVLQLPHGRIQADRRRGLVPRDSHHRAAAAR